MKLKYTIPDHIIKYCFALLCSRPLRTRRQLTTLILIDIIVSDALQHVLVSTSISSNSLCAFDIGYNRSLLLGDRYQFVLDILQVSASRLCKSTRIVRNIIQLTYQSKLAIDCSIQKSTSRLGDQNDVSLCDKCQKYLFHYSIATRTLRIQTQALYVNMLGFILSAEGACVMENENKEETLSNCKIILGMWLTQSPNRTKMK